MFAAAGMSTISRFSAKSSSHSGTPSPLQFPATPSLQFTVAPSLLRMFAGSKGIDADAMSRWSSCWYSMIVQELPKGLSSKSCRRFASRFGLDAARDRWATRTCYRALCKTCPGTIRQEYSRAAAQ